MYHNLQDKQNRLLRSADVYLYCPQFRCYRPNLSVFHRYKYGVLVSSISGSFLQVEILTLMHIRAGALVLFGLGGGLGVQLPMMVPQTVLSGPEIPVGTSLMIFVQTISGALFLSVGTNVLQDRLIAELQETAPQVDPEIVFAAGAAQLETSMEKVYPQYVSEIMKAYGKALQAVFLIFVVMAALSVLGVTVVEWKSVRKDKKQATGSATEKKDLTA